MMSLTRPVEGLNPIAHGTAKNHGHLHLICSCAKGKQNNGFNEHTLAGKGYGARSSGQATLCCHSLPRGWRQELGKGNGSCSQVYRIHERAGGGAG